MSSKKRTRYTIIVSGGGTGGHYYPALAIMEAIRQRSSELPASLRIDCHYVGSSFGIEARLAPQSDFPCTLIPVRGFSRYMTFKAQARNLLLPFRLLISFIRIALLYRRLDPVATVATGGYASAIPGQLSNLRHIPLFVQEQNAYPGVTSRLLAKKAMAFFYAYEAVKEHIRNDVLFIRSGNPLRNAIRRIPREEARKKMDLKNDVFTLFVFGGSQGSASINRYLAKRIESWIYKYGIQVLWQTGESSYAELNRTLGTNPNIRLMKYINEMSAAYSACDMVISRAGALSLAEIEQLRVPAILIPLPGAAGNHQYFNAKTLEALGCAYLIEEKEFPNNPFTPILNAMIRDPQQLEKMRAAFPEREENAADGIARNILNRLQSFYAWS
ncbi:MAG: UDP-N-acetylglucosamine--N-acetylmuramyl-(pentapeptide) pyrophosphoryl-undecaprenol N-acetylglucosamine transferase [Candidatus Neomarinimicrobiota bacterium]|jgi:UDP-N-acetylglucosamine--N-acetylmuramyl-(pentapeptide) pyrophosphoryl-undecaprenol N-acetylglucosamine transferase|nr:UDP-N-acetylglucosamine--N-acetylmuramyl-(pentapeptide) pyrophosphoryl-undecaprenol N-acetylglucosamine transferase [Candidatus Neomarinimicrobiota bacterium]MDD3965813.1 UDP-N-acetylglucosamine--N-acetylmuramyl-(pentapeptide) pyrophosphoryl-undecaprenol N-acetylglucosamine transferase [Candidatus Neomarinimicrobiota bacterium]MDX9779519.1 UDP-N-acetylglucosamine--N-acetylmuramyl-(pentapeptide) pyrophosphoryl-undecaprenol N-acetylglucosamine transferase [bacterium]